MPKRKTPKKGDTTSVVNGKKQTLDVVAPSVNGKDHHHTAQHDETPSTSSAAEQCSQCGARPSDYQWLKEQLGNADIVVRKYQQMRDEVAILTSNCDYYRCENDRLKRDKEELSEKLQHAAVEARRESANDVSKLSEQLADQMRRVSEMWERQDAMMKQREEDSRTKARMAGELSDAKFGKTQLERDVEAYKTKFNAVVTKCRELGELAKREQSRAQTAETKLKTQTKSGAAMRTAKALAKRTARAINKLPSHHINTRLHNELLTLSQSWTAFTTDSSALRSPTNSVVDESMDGSDQEAAAELDALLEDGATGTGLADDVDFSPPAEMANPTARAPSTRARGRGRGTGRGRGRGKSVERASPTTTTPTPTQSMMKLPPSPVGVNPNEPVPRQAREPQPRPTSPTITMPTPTTATPTTTTPTHTVPRVESPTPSTCSSSSILARQLSQELAASTDGSAGRRRRSTRLAATKTVEMLRTHGEDVETPRTHDEDETQRTHDDVEKLRTHDDVDTPRTLGDIMEKLRTHAGVDTPTTMHVEASALAEERHRDDSPAAMEVEHVHIQQSVQEYTTHTTLEMEQAPPEAVQSRQDEIPKSPSPEPPEMMSPDTTTLDLDYSQEEIPPIPPRESTPPPISPSPVSVDGPPDELLSSPSSEVDLEPLLECLRNTLHETDALSPLNVTEETSDTEDLDFEIDLEIENVTSVNPVEMDTDIQATSSAPPPQVESALVSAMISPTEFRVVDWLRACAATEHISLVPVGSTVSEQAVNSELVDPDSVADASNIPVEEPVPSQRRVTRSESQTAFLEAFGAVTPSLPSSAKSTTDDESTSFAPYGTPDRKLKAAVESSPSRISLLSAAHQPIVLPAPVAMPCSTVVTAVESSLDILQSTGATQSAPPPPPISPKTAKKRTAVEETVEEIMCASLGDAPQPAKSCVEKKKGRTQKKPVEDIGVRKATRPVMKAIRKAKGEVPKKEKKETKKKSNKKDVEVAVAKEPTTGEERPAEETTDVSPPKRKKLQRTAPKNSDSDSEDESQLLIDDDGVEEEPKAKGRTSKAGGRTAGASSSASKTPPHSPRVGSVSHSPRKAVVHLRSPCVTVSDSVIPTRTSHIQLFPITSAGPKGIQRSLGSYLDRLLTGTGSSKVSPVTTYKNIQELQSKQKAQITVESLATAITQALLNTSGDMIRSALKSARAGRLELPYLAMSDKILFELCTDYIAKDVEHSDWCNICDSLGQNIGGVLLDATTNSLDQRQEAALCRFYAYLCYRNGNPNAVQSLSMMMNRTALRRNFVTNILSMMLVEAKPFEPLASNVFFCDCFYALLEQRPAAVKKDVDNLIGTVLPHLQLKRSLGGLESQLDKAVEFILTKTSGKPILETTTDIVYQPSCIKKIEERVLPVIRSAPPVLLLAKFMRPALDMAKEHVKVDPSVDRSQSEQSTALHLMLLCDALQFGVSYAASGVDEEYRAEWTREVEAVAEELFDTVSLLIQPTTTADHLVILAALRLLCYASPLDSARAVEVMEDCVENCSRHIPATILNALKSCYVGFAR